MTGARYQPMCPLLRDHCYGAPCAWSMRLDEKDGRTAYACAVPLMSGSLGREVAVVADGEHPRYERAKPW